MKHNCFLVQAKPSLSHLRTLGLEHIRDAVEGLSAMGNMSVAGDERQECRH